MQYDTYKRADSAIWCIKLMIHQYNEQDEICTLVYGYFFLEP